MVKVVESASSGFKRRSEIFRWVLELLEIWMGNTPAEICEVGGYTILMARVEKLGMMLGLDEIRLGGARVVKPVESRSSGFEGSSEIFRWVLDLLEIWMGGAPAEM